MWPGRCGASASASCRATACASSCRPTTSTGPGSSTDIASERALIDAAARALRPRGQRIVRWLGDDAAVVRARPMAVTSVDVMVDGVHFELGRASWHDVGHRALAGALSDLAAMGADPGEAYVGLVLPAGAREADVAALYAGMGGPARPTGPGVPGGGGRAGGAPRPAR